jgi:hypothetical protein
MGAFIQQMAARHDEAMAAFLERARELRISALSNPAHARTPDIIAGLQAAFEQFLEFVEACGAINPSLRKLHQEDCWDALLGLAVAQANHQTESEPAARFISILRACLSSGQAHLAVRDGGVPQHLPESCGWRLESAVWRQQGNCVGWIDGNDVYLEPTASYQAVQEAARASGEALPVSGQTLRKRLQEKGFLASIDEPRKTNTVRRKIAGSKKDVLHLLRITLLPDGSDSDGEEGGVGD